MAGHLKKEHPQTGGLLKLLGFGQAKRAGKSLQKAKSRTEQYFDDPTGSKKKKKKGR